MELCLELGRFDFHKFITLYAPDSDSNSDSVDSALNVIPLLKFVDLFHFSTTDKVSYRQHTEDLEVLERKLSKRIDDKVRVSIYHIFQGCLMLFKILSPNGDSCCRKRKTLTEKMLKLFSQNCVSIESS